MLNHGAYFSVQQFSGETCFRYFFERGKVKHACRKDTAAEKTLSRLWKLYCADNCGWPKQLLKNFEKLTMPKI